jgi:hypothetical protein
VARLALVALALALPALATAAVTPARQISVDPIVGAGQHETAVEPDSTSFGNTVVAAFQVGRFSDGGASAIGWATSRDGGATWQSGLLPSLTVQAPSPGPFARASDPAVAYDRVHATFLANVLALRDAGLPDPASSLLTSRSPDGLSWSAPVVTAPDEGSFVHDKNWIACDNGTASRFAGRCYVVWTGPAESLGISSSSDGGVTWSRPATSSEIRGIGWQPVARPDGTLVIVYATERNGIRAVSSRDGGASFGPPVTVSDLQTAPVPGVRAPAFHSLEPDAAGTIRVAWQDCRYRDNCTSNDIVLASSTDGRRWSRPRRVPTAPELDGLNHFVPGLAVDATTRGRTARIALAFSVLTPRDCTTQTCRVQQYFVSSATGGRTWSAPEALSSPQPLSAFPQAGRRFLGDYISASFAAGGVAVPVFAAATAPFDGRYHQGVFATAIPPLPARPAPLAVGSPRVTPARPRRGASVRVTATVAGSSRTAIACRASGARVRLRFTGARNVGGRVACTWRIVAGQRNAPVAGTLTIASPETEVTRRFGFRLR